jgi:hypothetical protein
MVKTVSFKRLILRAVPRQMSPGLICKQFIHDEDGWVGPTKSKIK